MKGGLRNMAAMLFAGSGIDVRQHKVTRPPIALPGPREPRPIKSRNGDTVGYAFPDKRTRRFKNGQYGRGGAPSSKRRQDHIDAHNRNPLNFLPGAVVHNLYREEFSSQRVMENRAHEILMRLIGNGYRPKPGYDNSTRTNAARRFAT
jgi:hypothetical protein